MLGTFEMPTTHCDPGGASCLNVMRMGAANQPRCDHIPHAFFSAYGRISRLVSVMLPRLKLAMLP